MFWGYHCCNGSTVEKYKECLNFDFDGKLSQMRKRHQKKINNSMDMGR